MDPPATPSSKRRKLTDIVPTFPKRLSDLLASFGASRSPMSTSRMNKETAGSRQKPAVSYAESESSNALSSPHSSFEDSPSSKLPETDGEDDDNEEEQQTSSQDVIHAVPRGTMAISTRQLPARSTRKAVSYAAPPRPIKKGKSTRGEAKIKILTSDTVTSKAKASTAQKPSTARGQIRQDIALHTKPKRDAFYLAHKDIFLPLLPQNNYIVKLQRSLATGDQNLEVPDIVPFEALATQPRGVTATMKPYQLEGLSFVANMYENGVSAILGDEMGLGKTLQTLSLFQHVKENHTDLVAGENRPFLVVCPLSVLSSWINETTRWTPELKVIRFHGPKHERDRLKQETLGLIDRYGQQTTKSKSKSQAKNRGRPKKSADEPEVIDLHTSDDEATAEKPVDVVVTTYETFVAEQSWFKRAFAWRYVVLDEGHKVKNEKSDVASALQTLQAEHRLLLTGTPLQNNLHELWALLHWLYPDVFTEDTSVNFKQAFNLTQGKASTSFMDHARRLLEVIMLRRMKNSPGVNLGLPPKTEILLFVPLTPMQRLWYKRLLTKMDTMMLQDLFGGAKAKEEQAIKRESAEDKELALIKDDPEGLHGDHGSDVWAETKEIMTQTMADSTESKGNEWQKLMNIIMQLRKCCSHPYLLPGAFPEPYYLGDHVRMASGKFILLDKLVQELVIARRKKILIFSGWTKTLDLVEDLLALKGANAPNGNFKYTRFDGSTPRATRNLAIRMFNSQKTDYRVMLISTRAGGLGINLTSAENVILMDEDWNPQVTLQAEARAHRIGQKNCVTVYKLCTQGTVEEQMMGRIRKKLYLSAKITESSRNLHTADSQDKKRKRGPRTNAMDDDAPQLGTSELKTLLRRGAQTLSAPAVDVTEMLSWDWQTTLEKCKDRPNDRHVTDPTGNAKAEEVDEEAWLNNVEKVEAAVFEGKRHQREIEKATKDAVELVRMDRRAGKNTTVMVDGFAISKESMGCGDWEAVPTLAGKDPRLAEPKKVKKATFEHQDHCQVCWDGGELSTCSGCPRSYHLKCLDGDMKARARASFGNFYCPQHQCFDCEKKTVDAGGLIYRCRWCEKGSCEDCLVWDGPEKNVDLSQLYGENLPELEMLGYDRAKTGGFYYDCPSCKANWKTDTADFRRCQAERAEIEQMYRRFLDAQEDVVKADVSTPMTSSEAITPVDVEMPVAKKFKIKVGGR